MADFLGVYNPNDVSVIVNGVAVEGFAEGTFVEVERSKPEEFMAKVGAKGDFTFVKNLDKSGRIRVVLKQNANRMNAYFSSLLESEAIFDIQIIRKTGTYKELASATTCVIGQRPRIVMADDEQARQWEFLAGRVTETEKIEA